MAYVTGLASSMADVVTAVRNACTANGWTLAGDVLSKGVCHAEVKTGTLGTSTLTGGYFRLRVANDASLADAAQYPVYFGPLMDAANVWANWQWPATYHVHVNESPDEVVVLVNYNGDLWAWAAFGSSPAPGNAGTGNWHAATMSSTSGQKRASALVSSPEATSSIDGASWTPLPFWTRGRLGPSPAYSVHGAISNANGGPRWSNGTESFDFQADRTVNAADAIKPLLSMSPNAWNSESILLPLQVIQARPDAKVSLINQIVHLRVCRNDYVMPGQVITLGTDRWKVYPAYRRSTQNRDGLNGVHTGTLAIAVRYDGP
ncbi:MAG: hypothetical protein DI635_00830 [Pseudoxanthomonas suwonensis]|nr:MAG: hypothetical protein DI635_00830 [Pseudoxanthomonas suwonensis]